MSRVHAYADDALAELDATGIHDALAARTVSVPEVVEAAIARTQTVDPDLGAVAHPAWEEARREARHPRPGWFSGVPTFVKDNCDAAGMPTGHGTDAFVPEPAAEDGDFTRMFRATGLLPLGKTRLSEFGFSPAADHPRLGPVRNPWDTDHYAGASSAGSAALVAAGAVPLAHANDGGGSIRIPASVNGLVGLKPTRGRLPQDAVMREMPVRIIADGVVTRSVRDTAAFLREAERVWCNPRLGPVGDVTRPGRKRLRVAVATRGVGRDASPEVRDLTLGTAALLADLGHEVEEADLPVAPGMTDDFLLYWSMLAMVTVRRGRRAFGPSWDPERLDDLTLGLARHARRHLHRLPGAIASVSRSSRRAARHHATYDVTLTPTLATGTPRVGELRPVGEYGDIMDRILDWVAFTPLQNATGEPAVSLPLAAEASGLPVGMMFASGAGREALLLGLALELEEAAPWPRIQD
jgi:amidase